MNGKRKPISGLICSQLQFEALHEALDRTRSTSLTVKVNREALQALLVDHSKLIDIIEKL